MSFKEFIEDPKTIGGITAAAAAGIWAWVTQKKNKDAEYHKTDAEAEEIRLRIKHDEAKYDAEKEERYQLKIDNLNKKLEEMTHLFQDFKEKYEQAMVIIDELKAENNLYKTIKS